MQKRHKRGDAELHTGWSIVGCGLQIIFLRSQWKALIDMPITYFSPEVSRTNGEPLLNMLLKYCKYYFYLLFVAGHVWPWMLSDVFKHSSWIAVRSIPVLFSLSCRAYFSVKVSTTRATCVSRVTAVENLSVAVTTMSFGVSVLLFPDHTVKVF